MREFLILILVILMFGCVERSMTRNVWKNLDEVVIIEERLLSKEDANKLKNCVNNGIVKYDGIGTFYVKQTIIERVIKTPLVIALTPFSIALDGLKILVVGAIVITPNNSAFLIEAIVKSCL